jgi:hypothetical protein
LMDLRPEFMPGPWLKRADDKDEQSGTSGPVYSMLGPGKKGWTSRWDALVT